MKHVSLFSGMGGFDLAAQWMGWENVFHCEWNPFGQKILNYYWPDAISYSDITKTDFTAHADTIDVLTGGFPCQPYSVAGKQKGKEDERHLWPEMLRAIREIRPRWVVGENVFGLVSWSRGLVFHEVQANLEAEGYEVFPYILPACAKNAPHKRERIWFVAYANGRRQPSQKYRQEEAVGATENGKERYAANSESQRLQGYRGFEEVVRFEGQVGSICSNEGDSASNVVDTWGFGRNEKSNGVGNFENREGEWKLSATDSPQSNWNEWPTQPPICNGNDGISSRLDTSAISFSKWRNESIKAGGNAIVPQVAYEIFKAIEQYENLQ